MRYREFDIEDVDLAAIVPRDGYLWSHIDEGFAAWGTAARIPVGHGPDRFAQAQADLDAFWQTVTYEVPDPLGPLAIASFTFTPPPFSRRNWSVIPTVPAPESVLVVPEVVVHKRNAECWLGVLGDGPVPKIDPRSPTSPVKVRYAGSSIPEVAWLEAVTRAVKSLRAGELEKVVLARDLAIWGEEEFDLPGLARYLIERFPGCYTFVCEGLVGATPELLIDRSGDTVSSLVLAGTAARGVDEAHDRALGQALLDSAKDQSEHAPALRSVTEVLEPLCSQLEVEPTPHLLSLANVQHLATSVRGRISTDHSALELAGLLHPTAAVCGQPADMAMDMIADLEGMDRGRYAGPIGWVDRNCNGAFGIALRCAEITGNRGRLYAGGGIVAASEPEAELEETRLKFRAMMSALQGSER